MSTSERPPALRTVAQILADPKYTGDYVIVDDHRRGQYEATGHTLVEDLAGTMCLMKRPGV